MQQGKTLRWAKATASATGNCVEVARTPDVIYVRDSKHPQGSVLTFGAECWVAFLANCRSGRFDLG